MGNVEKWRLSGPVRAISSLFTTLLMLMRTTPLAEVERTQAERENRAVKWERSVIKSCEIMFESFSNAVRLLNIER